MIPQRALGAVAVGVLILLVVLLNATFTVDQREFGLVTRFGNVVRVVDKPGLHFKQPFTDQVVTIDKRIRNLEAPPLVVTLQDQRRIEVDLFLRYRITDPATFYRSVRTFQVGDNRLSGITQTALRQVMGRATLPTLLSPERAKPMEEIRRLVNEQAQSSPAAANQPTRGLGIEVIDVRIGRADLPQANLESVFNRMRSEREREAAELQAQGDEDSARIRAEADRERTVIMATAEREAQKLRAEGDSQASGIYNEAYGRDPGFFQFWRSLQAYRSSLGSGTTLILSPSNTPFFHHLQGGHVPGAVTAPTP